jgi:Zn-dependent protease
MESIDSLRIITAVLALTVAVVGHEIMHGWIAYIYGDHTAKDAGRLTLNPIAHVDMVGTILVPASLYFIPMLLTGEGGFLFGWAKPVPVNMSRVIRNGGHNGAMQVDLAGIVYNFTLAVFVSLFLVAMSTPTDTDGVGYIFTYLFFYQLLVINVALGVFNLLPIPQFDGSHFLIHLSLKYKFIEVAEFFYKSESYGMIVAVIVLITPLRDYLIDLPVSIILQLLTT